MLVVVVVVVASVYILIMGVSNFVMSHDLRASYAHVLKQAYQLQKMTSNHSMALLPPSVKRARLGPEGGGISHEISLRKPVQLGSLQGKHIISEFPVRNLEDFYKDCPPYRLPVEIGSFSVDNKGKQVLDRSQLRYFSAPPPTSSRLNFDLMLGFDKYVPSPQSVPSEKLNPILRWVATNGDCFRPKQFSPKSPEKAGSDDGGGLVRGEDGSGLVRGEAERRISVGEVVSQAAPTSKDR